MQHILIVLFPIRGFPKHFNMHKRGIIERPRPANAGGAWDDKEDTKLIAEYKNGMKISEIAQIHQRTTGAIRSRLKKKGLIE